jgi:hypothetical protein
MMAVATAAGVLTLGVACTNQNGPEQLRLLALEYTVTSTWADPGPFHWQIRILKDGTAELRDFHDGSLRAQTARVGVFYVTRLGAYLCDTGFMSLSPVYAESDGSVQDAARHTLKVVTNLGSHEVYSYAWDAPATLWGLYEVLENIKERARWEEVP